jgi:hypothetical protein
LATYVCAWPLPCDEDLLDESGHLVVEILMILIVASVEVRGQLAVDEPQLVAYLCYGNMISKT